MRSKDSQVKTQLVLWIFILFKVTTTRSRCILGLWDSFYELQCLASSSSVIYLWPDDGLVIEAETCCHLVTLNKITIHNTSCVLTCESLLLICLSIVHSAILLCLLDTMLYCWFVANWIYFVTILSTGEDACSLMKDTLMTVTVFAWMARGGGDYQVHPHCAAFYARFRLLELLSSRLWCAADRPAPGVLIAVCPFWPGMWPRVTG
jgi:hypothetical protein